MRIKMLLLAGGAIFVCGCSSSSKQSTAAVPAAAAAPAKTEAPAKVEAAKNEMACKRGEEKRLLEVESLEPKGCKLWYSRYDTRSSVASSVLGTDHCEQVRERIKTKIVDAGFECAVADMAAKSSVASNPTKPMVDGQKNSDPSGK